MNKNELQSLRDLLGEDFCENVSMKRHTTFKTGGAAEYYLIPHTEEELAECIRELRGSDYPYYILGNGSNTLASDRGIKGIVISLRGLKGVHIENGIMTAKAGTLMSEAARSAQKAALSGLEFCYGIPGTIGGGIYMNAGAYGGEFSQLVESVRFFDKRGRIAEMDRDELDFSYRHSVFQGMEAVIVSAKLRLAPADPEEIQKKMDELMESRRAKQPLDYPSAGSTFKRPAGHYAAKLIEDAGLKGRTVGGAMVSEKHSGFIINYNNATSDDVLRLMEIVRSTVLERFGVELEPEIKVLGY